MITVDDVRRFALSLPEAHEQTHFDHPSFRVGSRIFATISEDELRSWLKVSRSEMLALAESDPTTFEAKPWGTTSWVGILLARVDPEEFHELLIDAWRGIATKRALMAFEANQG